MKNWFITPADGRLRAGWRLLIFFVIFAALSIAGQVGVRAMLGSLRAGSTLGLGIIAVAATIAVFIARRCIDKKTVRSLGFSRFGDGWSDLLFGFALSGAMAATIFAIMQGAGVLGDVRVNWGSAGSVTAMLLAGLLPMVFVGYWEEIVTRGYVYQNLEEGVGTKIAIVISCLLYGLLHSVNPHASLLSSSIIVLFGLLRLYGYLATRHLWLPIGGHVGWNFFQGTVFGYGVSGSDAGETLLSHTPQGPAWLSGGDFGPEASLFTVPVLFLAIYAIKLWSERPSAGRGRTVAAYAGNPT